MRALLPLLLLPLLACSGADPLPAGASTVAVHALVDGDRAPMRVAETGESVCCLGEVLLTQQELSSLEVVKGKLGVPEVQLHLTDKAAGTFAEHAAAHVGTRVAVVIDGDIRVAPLLLPDFETRWLTLTVRQPTGAAEAAEALADKLRPGLGKAAPAP